jgi:hypothetical protein
VLCKSRKFGIAQDPQANAHDWVVNMAGESAPGCKSQPALPGNMITRE